MRRLTARPHGIRDGGTIRADDPLLVAGRAQLRSAVALPAGADPEAPRDLNADEATTLIAAHRANGAVTTGHVAMLLAGPTGWTSTASDEARAVLTRLCGRGLMAAHPKRDFVFQLTTGGKGLAELLSEQARGAATDERK